MWQFCPTHVAKGSPTAFAARMPGLVVRLSRKGFKRLVGSSVRLTHLVLVLALLLGQLECITHELRAVSDEHLATYEDRAAGEGNV